MKSATFKQFGDKPTLKPYSCAVEGFDTVTVAPDFDHENKVFFSVWNPTPAKLNLI